jgi:hypothetical protein
MDVEIGRLEEGVGGFYSPQPEREGAMPDA